VLPLLCCLAWRHLHPDILGVQVWPLLVLPITRQVRRSGPVSPVSPALPRVCKPYQDLVLILILTDAGPLRHPKPLTPSDLHLVLEKEQEAMVRAHQRMSKYETNILNDKVNRLTRELSLLRQQTASVNSTTSSASNLTEPDGLHASPSLGSSTTPHVSRRQRSSSSLSSHTPATQGAQAASVSGIAPSRDASHPLRSTDHSLPRTIRSREPSVTSRRPSVGSLCSFSQYPHGDQLSHFGSPSIYPHRTSISQTHLGLSNATNSMARYEEATIHRSELESMKRENEQLRRRVRELENTLKKQKESVE
jgi:polyhydroxyalkanoate synthesis regulator phasin